MNNPSLTTFSFFNIDVTSFRKCIELPLRRTVVLFAFLLSCSYLPAQAASPQQTWEKANAFYQQKQYDSAAVYFEQIAITKPADATVFYNLGNTYYRLNNIGHAVLNYEKALKRKPDYKQASENLLLTQARIPGFTQPTQDIFFVRWWAALTSPGLIGLWSVTSLLLFIGLIGLLLYRQLSKGKVYIRPQIPGMLLLLWLFSLLLACSAAYAMIKNIRGVVITNNTAISRNDAKGKFAGTLAEGTTVRILSLQATIYEVELNDGRSGFISKSALKLVD